MEPTRRAVRRNLATTARASFGTLYRWTSDVPLADDGDIVRGLGFVALYSGYLEEAVDECIAVLQAVDPEANHRIGRQPISEKIRYCKRRLDAQHRSRRVALPRWRT